MKKVNIIIILLIIFVVGSYAQNATQARTVLNKTASILNRKGGLSFNFSMTGSKTGSVSGTIAIKGKKYNVRTSQATVWFNGKTQWTYMKKTNEVNITTPTLAQQQMMNPYAFINMYRSVYSLSMKTQGKNYIVHMKASNKSIQEIYVTINKSTHIPSAVKFRQGSEWTSITISKVSMNNQSDNIFTFRSKDFPGAEIVDLR